MRLVKRTVNQDDVSAYHLFYADAKGSPGTDLTFFDWPVQPERRGTRSITRTHLRVAGRAALAWWAQQFADSGVPAGELQERDGRAVLEFEDPEGQRLALIDDGGLGPAQPWDRSPVPAENQVRGLGPVMLSVPDLRPTAVLLERVLNMRSTRQYPHPDVARHTVHVFEMGPGGPAAELHIAVQPDLREAHQGAGGVHHVAFRTPTFEEHSGWIERLREYRVPNSGLVDRYYFRSLYFREPNGILFEIASDEPGFAVDEDPATLGESVVLPPFLEPQRASDSRQSRSAGLRGAQRRSRIPGAQNPDRKPGTAGRTGNARRGAGREQQPTARNSPDCWQPGGLWQRLRFGSQPPVRLPAVVGIDAPPGGSGQSVGPIAGYADSYATTSKTALAGSGAPRAAASGVGSSHPRSGGRRRAPVPAGPRRQRAVACQTLP